MAGWGYSSNITGENLHLRPRKLYFSKHLKPCLRNNFQIRVVIPECLRVGGGGITVCQATSFLTTIFLKEGTT